MPHDFARHGRLAPGASGRPRSRRAAAPWWLRPAFRRDLSPDPFEVRGAVTALEAALAAAGSAGPAAGQAALVVAEALNNIVEHAFAEAAAPAGPQSSAGDLAGRGLPAGRIGLRCSQLQGRMRVQLRDTGRAMPGLALPAGAAPDLAAAPDDLPEGGFGWFLIHALTADLGYRRRAGFNILEFTLDLDALA
ncbi:ATP-binding protein [Roseivivax sp. CAU 1761]